MIKNSLYFLIFIVVFIITSIQPVFADYGLGCSEKNLLGPLAKILCGSGATNENTATQLNNVISVVIGVMTIVAALWFIFQFLTAGYLWINSGGDKHNLEIARDRILNNIIGLIVVIATWVIMGVVGKIFGLDILNPGKVLIQLGQ